MRMTFVPLMRREYNSAQLVTILSWQKSETLHHFEFFPVHSCDAQLLSYSERIACAGTIGSQSMGV